MGTIKLWQVMEMTSADAEAYGYCPACETVSFLVHHTDCHFCGGETEACNTVGDILEAKRRSPFYRKLYENVKKNGLTCPIYISDNNGNRLVCNGHHRIAVCEDLGYKEIEYTSDILAGWDD